MGDGNTYIGLSQSEYERQLVSSWMRAAHIVGNLEAKNTRQTRENQPPDCFVRTATSIIPIEVTSAGDRNPYPPVKTNLPNYMDDVILEINKKSKKYLDRGIGVSDWILLVEVPAASLDVHDVHDMKIKLFQYSFREVWLYVQKSERNRDSFADEYERIVDRPYRIWVPLKNF